MFELRTSTEIEPYIYNIRKNNTSLNKEDKFCLERQYTKFNLPKKIYGTFEEDAEHILKYFLRNNKSLGVMFTGNTGSGKTLTSKLICNKALLHKYPVFIINGMPIDDDVIEYISMLNNCVIFLDEFGKLTEHKTQSIMLQMLTDTNKNILWIFANKDPYQIHREFFNRTERIRYYINYGKISKDVIIEYCKDNNVDDKFVNEILCSYSMLEEFSFDQLQGLVTEHLYVPSKSLEEISRLLNYKGFELKVSLCATDCQIDNPNYLITAYKLRLLRYGEDVSGKSKKISYRSLTDSIRNLNSFMSELFIDIIIKNKQTEEIENISNFPENYMSLIKIDNVEPKLIKDALILNIKAIHKKTNEEINAVLTIQLLTSDDEVVDIE